MREQATCSIFSNRLLLILLTLSILTNGIFMMRIKRPDLMVQMRSLFVAPPHVLPADHVRGTPGGKPTVFLYSDYQCPFSRNLYEKLVQLCATNRLVLVYRHFPLGQIHPLAVRAAEAAECAGAQGLFWEYSDLLFQNQDVMSDEVLHLFANNLGLDMAAFDNALAAGTFRDCVVGQQQEGVKREIEGAPVFFINGKRYMGDYSIDRLKALFLPSSPTPASETALTVAPQGPPKIKFASTIHDFGRISAGGIIHADFVFTNVGGRTLEIEDVRTTCDCATAASWARQVAPGSAGVIRLQVNTASLNGRVVKSAGVRCNDPVQSVINLQIKGIFWKAINVEPPFVMFNVIPTAASNDVRRVKITSNLERPIELSSPQVSIPAFRAEIITVRPGKEFELLITPVMPLPAGNVRAAITINTSATNMPVLNIIALAITQPSRAVPAQ